MIKLLQYNTAGHIIKQYNLSDIDFHDIAYNTIDLKDLETNIMYSVQLNFLQDRELTIWIDGKEYNGDMIKENILAFEGAVHNSKINDALKLI